MPQYVRTEYIVVRVIVEAADEDEAEDIGNDYTDSLLFDDKTLRKRAKEIDCSECRYQGAESLGDSEIAPYKPEKK